MLVVSTSSPCIFKQPTSLTDNFCLLCFQAIVFRSHYKIKIMCDHLSS